MDHSEDSFLKDAGFSIGMDEINNQSSVHGNTTHPDHTTDLMKEFDDKHEIKPSQYDSQPQADSPKSEHGLRHTSMNNVAHTDVMQNELARRTVEEDEVVSATKRHQSEPVPVLASQASELILQSPNIPASTSMAPPQIGGVHATDSENTHKAAKKAGRASRKRSKTKSNTPEQQPVQTVAYSPRAPSMITPENIVNAGGMLHGITQPEPLEFYGFSTYSYRPQDAQNFAHQYSPQYDLDPVWPISRPVTRASWCGPVIGGGFGFDEPETEDQSPYGHQRHVSSQYALHQYDGDSTNASADAAQGQSSYPDPESSHQSAYDLGRLMGQTSVPPPTVIGARGRATRSAQRQILPAGAPNHPGLAPSGAQLSTGTVTDNVPEKIQLRFKDLNQAEASMKQVKNPVHQGTDQSIPRNAEQERNYVRRIVAAMHSTAHARDNKTMIDMWQKQRQNAEAVEDVAWKLLRRCLTSHGQLDPLVPNGRFTRYTTFAEHIRDIINALTFEKTICRHVMAAIFQDQFIDDPLGAQHRVSNNRKVNGGKKAAIEEGRRAMGRSRSVLDSEAGEPDGSSPSIETDPAPSQLPNGSIGTSTLRGQAVTVQPTITLRFSDRNPNVDVFPLGGLTQADMDEALARSLQEREGQPATKKAKKGSAAKSGTKATRKRKTSEDSDDTYQPETKKTTKKGSTEGAQREYKGKKYPMVYDEESKRFVIKSADSPPRSTSARVQPGVTPEQLVSVLAQSSRPSVSQYPAPSAYHTSYQNPYQPSAAPSAYMTGMTYQDHQYAMTSAGNQGLSYGTAPMGSGFGSYDLYGQTHGSQRQVEHETRMRDVEASMETVDPRLTGRNPLNPSQPLSDLALPHAPGTVGNEFGQDEPEPEDLYEFSSLGTRRKRDRKPQP